VTRVGPSRLRTRGSRARGKVASRTGNRALVTVPLGCEHLLVRALVVRRRAPRRFPEETVTLLRSFAT